MVDRSIVMLAYQRVDTILKIHGHSYFISPIMVEPWSNNGHMTGYLHLNKFKPKKTTASGHHMWQKSMVDFPASPRCMTTVSPLVHEDNPLDSFYSYIPVVFPIRSPVYRH